MSKIQEALASFDTYEIYRIKNDIELKWYVSLYENRYKPYKERMFPTGEYYAVIDKETKAVYGGFEVITDAVVADRLYFGPVCAYLFSDLNLSVNLKDFGAVYIAEMATTEKGIHKGAMSDVLRHLIRSDLPMFIYPTHSKIVALCEQEGLTGYEDYSGIILPNYPEIYSNMNNVFEEKKSKTMHTEYATNLSIQIKQDAINWHREFSEKDTKYEQRKTFEELILGDLDLTCLIDYIDY